MFIPKFGEKNMGTQSFQNCVDQGLDCMKIDISRFRGNPRIGSLWMTSADSDDELRLATENHVSDSTKGKD